MREQTLDFDLHPKRDAALRRLRAYVDVNPVTGCHEWQGPLFKERGGYGIFTMRPLGVKTARAHRVAYALLVGPLRQREHLLHICDNPPCVNPAHLVKGSQTKNMADKCAKGRQTRGETHGMVKLTEKRVRAIRKDKRLQREIAAEHGVTIMTISDIQCRRSWRWLD